MLGLLEQHGDAQPLLVVHGTVGPGVSLVSRGSTQLTHDLSQVWTGHHSSLSQLVVSVYLSWLTIVPAECALPMILISSVSVVIPSKSLHLQLLNIERSEERVWWQSLWW